MTGLIVIKGPLIHMWSFEGNYKDYAGLASEPSVPTTYSDGVCGQVFLI